jgi:archaellum biogenesis protein FlaJ (TadC family)
MNNIEFNDYRVIVSLSHFDKLSFEEMLTIIISNEVNYFYLYDESEKINDVIKMPSYISSDWINYNKKELNIKILDELIKKFSSIHFGLDNSKLMVSELKSIKRDFIINKLIS